MLRALSRVLFGLILACVAAALTQVVFAVPPLHTAAAEFDRGELTLLAATHFMLFSAPFALVAAAIAEWQAIRSFGFYAFTAIAIALAGFAAQYVSEGTDLTILNDYAIKAFLSAGFAGGLVYWIVAGRNAGGAPIDEQKSEPRPILIAHETTAEGDKPA